MRHYVSILMLIASAASAELSSAAPPDYAQQVAPILKKYCAGCHNAEEHEGDLVLDRYQSLLAGGKHGAAITAGKSGESRLIKMITGKAKPEMPPEGNDKPKPEEIALLAAWIDAGAKGPAGAEPDPRVLVVPKIKPAANLRLPVTAVAAAPDGKHIAVAQHDTIQWLSSPARSLERKLAGHKGRINALSFSRDGSRLVAAAGEPGLVGEARLWNTADGALLRTFEGHKDALYAAVLSPDGNTLATSSYDQQIKLWNVADGKELRTLAGHNDAVYDLAFRPDGKILASASGDRTVKLWDVASGQRLDTLGQSLKELYAVAFTPDGKRVAAGGVDNRIRVWQVSADAKENTNLLLYSRFAHEGAVIKLAYSPDGKTLVSAAEDRTVKLWDAETVMERKAIERQSDWAPALAVSSDSKNVIVGRLDGTLALYDASTAQLVPPPPPAKPELAALSQHGLQIGTTARVKLSGKNLADVASVKSSHEKLAAAIVPGTANATDVDITLAAAADLAPGRYELWLTGPGGESEKRALLVSTLPQQSEKEPNDALTAANPVAMPVEVWGSLAVTGDIDTYTFAAKAGQTVVLAIDAATVGSKINALVTLFDAQGRVLAANNDFDNAMDSLASFKIPADGNYTVQVSDLVRSGSSNHFYRLSVGEFVMPTAVFPLGVAANQPAEVELIGVNVPAGTKVKLPAAASGTVEVPLDPKTYRVRRPLKVAVGSLAELVETEPNDEPAQATPIQVPATVNGRIWANRPGQKNDVDLYRFESKAGQTWIIETDAARSGSPVDTVIDVLSADGKPVPRLVLQATRDSNVTFRPIDASQRDCRLVNWEEMELNEYLYLNGEVCKLFMAPQGPDSGFTFYEGHNGKRRSYFDTTSTAHAVEEPTYIVEPHAPGSHLIASGLPVFALNHENDDDSERRLGTDSRLTFVAPAAGAYLVRVRDSQGHGGERFGYRLTVRQPKPDFSVSLAGSVAAVAAGSGKAITFNVDRIDGFDGEVRIDVSSMPPGFSISSPIVIQAGQRSAMGVLVADPKAVAPAAGQEPTIKATAMIDGHEVTKAVASFPVKWSEKPQILVTLEPAEVAIAPGSTVTAMLKIERNGFDGEVTFGVHNLPHGVIVDNIGLNGVLMLKGQTERKIFLTAARWVPETSRTCFAVAKEAGGQGSRPVTLHVRKSATVANAAAAAAAKP